MAYPTKPTGDDILSSDNIFAENNNSKSAMTTSELLGGYNNDGETETDLTSRPDANKFNMFLYQVHNTVSWIVKYIEELYNDKLSKTGGTMTGSLIMGNNKVSLSYTPSANTDATNKQYVDTAVNGAMWLGEVKCLSYPSIPTLPAGMEVVPCDGRAISRTTYASYFALIGTAFGAGDGSTTFNIPDYRGMVIRNYDARTANQGGRDVGRVFGTIQQSAIPTHTHTFSGTTANQSQNHTHDRGTMNITASGFMGEAYSDGEYKSFAQQASGALYYTGIGDSDTTKYYGSNGGIDHDDRVGKFDASRSWTGNTGGASQGHTHTYSGTVSTPNGANANANTTLRGSVDEARMINGTGYYVVRIK